MGENKSDGHQSQCVKSVNILLSFFYFSSSVCRSDEQQARGPEAEEVD